MSKNHNKSNTNLFGISKKIIKMDILRKLTTTEKMNEDNKVKKVRWKDKVNHEKSNDKEES